MASYSNSSSIGTISSSQETLTFSPTPAPSTEFEETKQTQTIITLVRRSERVRSGIVKTKKEPSGPIHIDLTQERRSKKKNDEAEKRTPTKETKGKEKVESVGVHIRGLPRLVVENIGLFSNKEIEAKYETSFKYRKVLIGRLVDLEILKRSNWELTSYIKKQDWGSFFEKDEKIYPNLTKAFYVGAIVEKPDKYCP
ncbi:hypothetical protein SESBI_37013 [Sesbania bispinosa]|nr:hypothetical protein SESBI_37013 [Sesbania bispinosa]